MGDPTAAPRARPRELNAIFAAAAAHADTAEDVAYQVADLEWLAESLWARLSAVQRAAWLASDELTDFWAALPADPAPPPDRSES